MNILYNKECCGCHMIYGHCILCTPLYFEKYPSDLSATIATRFMAIRAATFTGFDPYKLTGVRVTDRELGHGSYVCHCTRTGVHGTEMCWQEDP